MSGLNVFKSPVRTLVILGAVGLISACGANTIKYSPTVQVKKPATTVSSLLSSLHLNQLHDVCPSTPVPTPVYSVPWNQLHYIQIKPPTSGVPARVWAYFDYVNHKQYAKALATLDSVLQSMGRTKNYLYLRDQKHWTFIEMANITPYAPHETDTAGAYQSRVYYLAAVLNRAGLVPCDQTGYRSGLLQFAIYVEQLSPNSPWVTALQEFSPENPLLPPQ